MNLPKRLNLQEIEVGSSSDEREESFLEEKEESFPDEREGDNSILEPDDGWYSQFIKKISIFKSFFFYQKSGDVKLKTSGSGGGMDDVTYAEQQEAIDDLGSEIFFEEEIKPVFLKDNLPNTYYEYGYVPLLEPTNELELEETQDSPIKEIVVDSTKEEIQNNWIERIMRRIATLLDKYSITSKINNQISNELANVQRNQDDINDKAIENRSSIASTVTSPSLAEASKTHSRSLVGD